MNLEKFENALKIRETKRINNQLSAVQQKMAVRFPAFS